MPEDFVDECVAVLSRTPGVLKAMLSGLPEAWTEAAEGPGTWSPYAVVGHLIHGEKADWIPRLAIILEHGRGRPFDVFDREAQFRGGRTLGLAELLDEFEVLRGESLGRLMGLRLGAEELALEGTHPALGVVTVRQLIATWTAHDLAHILQVSRVMAKRMKSEVGPWAEYLSVMG